MACVKSHTRVSKKGKIHSVRGHNRKIGDRVLIKKGHPSFGGLKGTIIKIGKSMDKKDNLYVVSTEDGVWDFYDIELEK